MDEECLDSLPFPPVLSQDMWRFMGHVPAGVGGPRLVGFRCLLL